MTTTTPAPETAERKKRKRAAIIKFSLAGAALLGIGAAATSAAWTDQAWFQASATGATFELQGQDFAATPTYQDADGTGQNGVITVPPQTLANLVADDKRTLSLKIKNSGSVPMTLTQSSSWVAGSAATNFTSAPVVTVSGVPSGPFAAGAEATVTVTVTTPDAWDVSNQGKLQSLQLTFTGTSIGS